MPKLKQPHCLSLILIICLLGCLSPQVTTQSHPPSEESLNWFRTELVFGMLLPDGKPISKTDWQRYLTEVVTPRFPDGFTVLEAYGQYRMTSGILIKEPSRIILILHANRPESSEAIEELRSQYKKRFQQESVLRVTLPATVLF